MAAAAAAADTDVSKPVVLQTTEVDTIKEMGRSMSSKSFSGPDEKYRTSTGLAKWVLLNASNTNLVPRTHKYPMMRMVATYEHEEDAMNHLRRMKIEDVGVVTYLFKTSSNIPIMNSLEDMHDKATRDAHAERVIDEHAAFYERYDPKQRLDPADHRFLFFSTDEKKEADEEQMYFATDLLYLDPKYSVPGQTTFLIAVLPDPFASAETGHRPVVRVLASGTHDELKGMLTTAQLDLPDSFITTADFGTWYQMAKVKPNSSTKIRNFHSEIDFSKQIALNEERRQLKKITGRVDGAVETKKDA